MIALKQMMNPKSLQKTEKIIHEYGKVLEKLGQETMQKYPALVFPESLLPYPREVIKRALEERLRYYEDGKIRGSIKFSLGSLVAFIDDEEANKRNSELLNNKRFQGAVKKRLNKNE